MVIVQVEFSKFDLLDFDISYLCSFDFILDIKVFQI